jgi:phage gp36-like protein
MTYCTIAQITSEVPDADLVQITNDIAGGSTVDNTVITNAIDYVDNIIDGYLRGRYTLPLPTVPDELKYIAIDYVKYRLYSRRMYTEIPPVIEQRYKEITQLLKDIQSGKFSLGVETISDSPLTTDKTLTSSSTNKYYNQAKWDQYDSYLNGF